MDSKVQAVHNHGPRPTPRHRSTWHPSDAYKDVTAVVDAADEAGLSQKVAKLEPMICIKG